MESVNANKLTLTPYDNERLLSLCGRFDEHLRQIERSFGVEIVVRSNKFSFNFFAVQDVVRHAIVQNIIKAYES